MKYVKILLLSFFVISSYSYAQETEVEAQPEEEETDF